MQQLHSDQKDLIAMYRQMQNAMVSADTRTLATMLAEEFHLIHMTGYDQPRDEWLAHIESGEMRYFSSQEKQVAVKVDGTTARLAGRNQVKANIWGAAGTWPLLLEIDFSHVHGRWLMTVARASMY